jgi:hypothetical protein
MAIAMVVTITQPSAALMEVIVITSMRSIRTALSHIQKILEIAFFVVVVTIIQPSVASMEVVVKVSMRSIPTALSLIHHGLEMAIVIKISLVTIIQPSVASMEAIVLVARPSLLVGIFLYEQLHLPFLQFYGCIDSCKDNIRSLFLVYLRGKAYVFIWFRWKS